MIPWISNLSCILYFIFWQLFLEAAEECCKNQNVQPTQVFLQKMIQTYEMMIVRHGYVVLGLCTVQYSMRYTIAHTTWT